tara:strand:- start:1296 stop:1742 length:447 start_codon:yes stop_codon:yes gene_type:complete
MTVNNKIIDLIQGRLNKGQAEYNREVPIRRERGKTNIAESIEEILDLVVYLTAYLLELEEDSKTQLLKSPSVLKCEVMDIRTILKALHMYHSEAWNENEQSTANEILTLINSIKEKAGWDHEDDKQIGQTDNPINKPFVNCIEGSNCD